MIRKITDLIIRMTKVRWLLIFLAVFFGIEIGFFLGMQRFGELTGGPLLDMSVGYNAAFAYERLHTFGSAANIYFRIRLLDFIFPASYGFGISIIASFIYRKKYDDPDNYRWVLAAPFLAAAFDYAENIILVILYRSLPAEFPAAATALNVVSIFKFGLLGLSVLLCVTGFFALLKGGDSMLLRGNKFRGGKQDDGRREND